MVYAPAAWIDYGPRLEFRRQIPIRGLLHAQRVRIVVGHRGEIEIRWSPARRNNDTCVYAPTSANVGRRPVGGGTAVITDQRAVHDHPVEGDVRCYSDLQVEVVVSGAINASPHGKSGVGRIRTVRRIRHGSYLGERQKARISVFIELLRVRDREGWHAVRISSTGGDDDVYGRTRARISKQVVIYLYGIAKLTTDYVDVGAVKVGCWCRWRESTGA